MQFKAPLSNQQPAWLLLAKMSSKTANAQARLVSPAASSLSHAANASERKQFSLRGCASAALSIAIFADCKLSNGNGQRLHIVQTATAHADAVWLWDASHAGEAQSASWSLISIKCKQSGAEQ